MTLLAWETRNEKRHKKALTLCKNYNLKLVQKTLYLGNLYTKERNQLYGKCTKLFNKKTDKIILVTVCQPCFEDALIDDTIKCNAKMFKDYEFVQIFEKPSKR